MQVLEKCRGWETEFPFDKVNALTSRVHQETITDVIPPASPNHQECLPTTRGEKAPELYQMSSDNKMRKSR